jgi:uncharacterized membrane protein
MLKRILNAIGDWNPQLLREWQGRFKPWDITGAFTVSAIAQFVFISQRRGLLPYGIPNSQRYCTGAAIAPDGGIMVNGSYDPQCLKGAAGEALINWQLWWYDNFIPLTQMLLGAVIVAGVYLLISDFIFEERRGTLGFVRLSPSSGKGILWGKLLGVPTLVYVALAIAMPLHLYTAVQGQVPVGVLVGTYVVGAASCLFFLSGALLWSVTTSVLGYLQPWAGAGFAALTVWGLINIPFPYHHADAMTWLWSFDPTIMLRHLPSRFYPRNFQTLTWFGLSYNSNPWHLMLFTTTYLSVWTYWIWQALLRRFQNARGTALSKKQSYAFTACLIGSVTGFGWANHSTATLSLCAVICLVVVTLITPNRQTLQEWARYRHHSPHKSLVADLLWGEKSPALLAVAVNMAIALVLLFPIVVVTSGQYLDGIVQLFAFAISILTLAAIFQVMLMLRTGRPEIWAIGVWVALWLVPPMLGTFLSLSNGNFVWGFSIAPWIAVGYVRWNTVLLTLMAQMSLFSLLTYRMTRQLHRVGASESKALLT